MSFVERSENGRRVFYDRDVILLNTIECLKKTGMQLKEIKQYVYWCEEGFSTVPQRLELMRKRKDEVQEQIADLDKMLATIAHKCEIYEKSFESGTTNLCGLDQSSWADEILLG